MFGPPGIGPPGMGPPVGFNAQGDPHPFGYGFNSQGDPIAFATNSMGDAVPWDVVQSTVTGDPAPYRFDSAGNRLPTVQEFFGQTIQPRPMRYMQGPGGVRGPVLSPADQRQRAELRRAADERRAAEGRRIAAEQEAVHAAQVQLAADRYGPPALLVLRVRKIDRQLRRHGPNPVGARVVVFGLIVVAVSTLLASWTSRSTSVPRFGGPFARSPDWLPDVFVRSALWPVLIAAVASGSLLFAGVRQAVRGPFNPLAALFGACVTVAATLVVMWRARYGWTPAPPAALATPPSWTPAVVLRGNVPWAEMVASVAFALTLANVAAVRWGRVRARTASVLTQRRRNLVGRIGCGKPSCTRCDEQIAVTR